MTLQAQTVGSKAGGGERVFAQLWAAFEREWAVWQQRADARAALTDAAKALVRECPGTPTAWLLLLRFLRKYAFRLVTFVLMLTASVLFRRLGRSTLSRDRPQCLGAVYAGPARSGQSM